MKPLRELLDLVKRFLDVVRVLIELFDSIK